MNSITNNATAILLVVFFKRSEYSLVPTLYEKRFRAENRRRFRGYVQVNFVLLLNSFFFFLGESRKLRENFSLCAGRRGDRDFLYRSQL